MTLLNFIILLYLCVRLNNCVISESYISSKHNDSNASQVSDYIGANFFFFVNCTFLSHRWLLSRIYTEIDSRSIRALLNFYCYLRRQLITFCTYSVRGRRLDFLFQSFHKQFKDFAKDTKFPKIWESLPITFIYLLNHICHLKLTVLWNL